jgi:cytochrome c oxidase subunit 1
MPLQIGAPDVAFPRLNMFAYWLYLFGGAIAGAGFLTPQGAAAFGWFAYAPLSDNSYSPGLGGDLWVFGLALSGVRHDPRRGQLHHDDHLYAGPGHDDVPDADVHVDHPRDVDPGAHRVPGPAAALLALGADRRFGAHVFDAESGGAMLWQHLFWFFGHPEVYIIALPFFGIISEVLPSSRASRSSATRRWCSR